LEEGASSPKKIIRANTGTARDFERRGNWEQRTEGRPHALYEAWWGKNITNRTIPFSDDFDNDAGAVPEDSDNDASRRDVSSPPPVGMPPIHTIVNIDHAIGGKDVIGEILLRQEFVTTLAFIESIASLRPKSGVVVTGQPGIGEHRC
jgi:hypothetical protein